MRLPLIPAMAAAFAAAVLAQAAVPAQNPNGLMLGSWKSRMEFDAVRVVCGKSVVLDDAFDREQSGWTREGGDWRIADGVLRQSSLAAPAITRHPFTCADSNYTVYARVRKTGGAEGFLIGFGAQDPENFYWLNLGGWGNSAHRLEKTLHGYRSPIGPEVKGSIETDRWYVVRIVVEGRRIRCHLDGQLLVDVEDPGFAPLLADNDKVNFGKALIPDLVADASIVEINGTFYCYATTDGWGQGLATSGTPVVWKSKDFLNWSFERSIFPPDFDLKYWAPSAPVHRNGRYYLYPTLDGQITAVVSDSPRGPFLTPDGRHVTRATLQRFPIEQRSCIDAEVFTDDDGQAYMVWSRRRAVKLKPDLLSPDGRMVIIPTSRRGYSEGPFLAKRNGIYYYFYTLGGGENYQYAYMMSRESPLGPWETPREDLIATSDVEEKIFGPGHGCFFRLEGTDDWYFVYLEYGRGGTTRQVYADRMHFNADGTIQPIMLTKRGVGALRPVANVSPNLAASASVTTSSVRPMHRVALHSDPGQGRFETYAPANAIDEYNGTRWMAAADDATPWFQVDLGAPRDIRSTEAYFVKPAAGHAYRLEWSPDGQTWQPYGGHEDLILRSPHRDEKSIRAQYLKLTILQGEPGLWEFRIY
jgi:hypothetical protein